MNTKVTYAAAICASALLPSLVFLASPGSIIAENSQDVSFYQGDMTVVFACFIGATVFFAALLAAFSQNGRHCGLAVIGALSVHVIAWNSLFPLVWVTSKASLSAFFVVEGLALALTVRVLIRVPDNLLAFTLGLFAILNVASTSVQNYHLWRSLATGPSASPYSARPADFPESTAESGRLIYHVVLDAFSPAYLDKVLADGRDPQLAGFTYYPNATANYGRTNISMRSVFHGTLHGNPFLPWADNSFNNGFTDRLAKAGYSQIYYPFYSSYCHPSALLCNATADLYNLKRHAFGRDVLIDLIFAKSMPVSVRNFMLGSINQASRSRDTWDYGFSLTSWLAGKDEEHALLRRPFQSFTMDSLEEFLNLEPALPNGNRYTYLHLMVPHSPWVFTRDCTYNFPAQAIKPRDVQASEQSECALTTVRRISQTLRELGRFDRSLIVVHSDHGIGEPTITEAWRGGLFSGPHVDRDTKTSEISPQQIASVANVLLLIKAPDQQQFVRKNQALQLIDIAPTVLDYAEVPHSDLPGVSALRRESLGSRERLYYESATGWLDQIEHFSIYRRRKDWAYVSDVRIAR